MIEEVLEERGSRYGTFADHAVIAQSLVDVIRAQPNWSVMRADARQALTVICDKIARMLNGDPEYDDNWVDIIGYATLVLNRMKAEQREDALTKMVALDQEMGLYDETRASDEGMILNKQPPEPKADWPLSVPTLDVKVELGDEGYFIRKHDEKANEY